MLRPLAFTLRQRSATRCKRRARRRRGAADLLRQHGRAHAAAAGGVEAVLHGHVVVDRHAGDLDAVGLRQLGGHLEVQHVAGVVLDDVQHARAAVDRPGGGEHLIGHRRGEDRAGAGRVEHAAPDEAAVHRLVAAAAAGDDAHLAAHRRVRAHDDTILEVDTHQIGMRGRDALKLVLDH